MKPKFKIGDIVETTGFNSFDNDLADNFIIVGKVTYILKWSKSQNLWRYKLEGLNQLIHEDKLKLVN